MRALLSVYDKTGLVELAAGLSDLGWELVASGQTSKALAEAGLEHRQVAELTGFPEILDGRVKTLHPQIHGAILADRSKPGHLEDLREHGITPIDLVVSNLYPFSSDPSVELIDIGGPGMVRAAAKNFEHVGVVVSPDDYPSVLEELRRSGSLSPATRRGLARRAFAHTAGYDAAIVEWLDGLEADDAGEAARASLPPTLHLTLERAQDLRYGENPHQRGARYRRAGASSWWDAVVQHSGRELSYLNLFDADAAWRLVHEMVGLGATPAWGAAHGDAPAAVAIIKHANPCGAAIASDLATAYGRALESDPLSAFGGIVALSGPVTDEVAALMAEGPQADVVVAPRYEGGSLALLTARRKATRLLEAGPPEAATRQVRTIGTSLLVQDVDRVGLDTSEWTVMTKGAPTEAQWRDLALAWLVCARTTSNSIAVVTDGQAVGVGAGQQSRVVAAELAVSKAGERARGGAGASDAFFPFPDGLEVLARAGVTAVAQPGGSVRDGEVVAAAEAAGVVMVATGERHFRH
ncbi:MAG TPA: bifunctional phosphoribosylaminoimidazolecarboxamide formyltransferase/IMP cyclohydrolase [Acidimicrobiales bacterium]|nr:bifunctional phosphoribosylaminoimidazolecarboxamide formyltransferase/IMP cyclohydrolase [Acidimicrobiales bacterium]